MSGATAALHVAPLPAWGWPFLAAWAMFAGALVLAGGEWFGRRTASRLQRLDRAPRFRRELLKAARRRRRQANACFDVGVALALVSAALGLWAVVT